MAQKNVVEYILDIKTKAAEEGLEDVVDALEKVEKELKDTQKQSKKTSTSMQKMKNVGMALGKVGAVISAVALAVGAAGAAAFGAAKKVTDLTNELNDLSVRSGVSTKTLQGLRQAMLSSGQPAEGLVEVLGAISGQFAQLSTEGSAVQKKFESFGIAVKDASGEVRSNNDILIDSIKLLQGISDSSERSRTAVLLFGEAGAKLNQALAAGDFEKFLSFTEKFGIEAGPEASKAAAEFQVALSGLGTVLNGTLQKFVNATKLQNRFIKSLIDIGSVLAFVGSLLDSFSNEIGRFVDSFVRDFKTLIDILGFFVDLVLEIVPKTEGFSGALEKASLDAQEFRDSMNSFTDSMSDLESAISSSSNQMENLGNTTKKTSKEMRTLTDIMNSLLGRFIKVDIPKIIKDLSIIGSAISDPLSESILKFSSNFSKALTNIGLFAKIVSRGVSDDFIKSSSDFFKQTGAISVDVAGTTATKIAKIFDNKLGDVLRNIANEFIEKIDSIAAQIGGFDIDSEGRFTKFRNKFKNVVQSASSEGLIGAFKSLGKVGKIASIIATILFAGIKIAAKLGQRGSTVAEIEKSVEQDIRARAKAIELGLQALPRILVSVLPKMLIEFADRLIFGLLKGIAEIIKIRVDLFKSLFTKEGRQERKEKRQERKEERQEEFKRRLKELISIAGFRSGGRYIPSARGGIKFTGMQEEGLALLHRGEFVVPETGQMPQAVQRTMGMGGNGINITINAAVVESNAVDELVRQIERRFQTFGSSTSPLFGGR